MGLVKYDSTNKQEIIMNINQFSFSNYDDTKWDTVVINGNNYPMMDGVIVTRDYNFSDVVVHSHQQELVQKCYDEYLKNLGLNTPISHIEVIPNHYGSIYLGWSSDDHNEMVVWLGQLLKDIEYENIIYHKHMPTNMEEIVNAYTSIYGDPEDMGMTIDEGYDQYVEGCKLLGFDFEAREEYEFG